MSLLVLVTRPLEQAKDFAEQIKSAGHRPLLCPLLEIEHIPTSLSSLQKPDAVLLSSVQGLHSVSVPLEWLSIPVYCVGQRTAEVARGTGFMNVVAGVGDVHDILPRIQENTPQNGHVLYLRGEDVSTEIQGYLKGLSITEEITYRAIPVTKIDPSIIGQFPHLDVITVFSARTGKTLRKLMSEHGLDAYAKTINLLCLSQAVVESLDGPQGALDWKSCIVSDTPNQNSLLDAFVKLK